jgi:hypothetical protein
MFTKVFRDLGSRKLGDGFCGGDSYALNPESLGESVDI